MIIDLHTHTHPASYDTFLKPGDLISRAKERGLEGLCLTEHDQFWEGKKVAKLARGHDFLVLPGVEINTDEGHLLVFGLERYVFGMHHPDFLRRLVDEAGGAMILAHPYRRRLSAGNPQKEQHIFSLVDAVEVLNGNGSQKENDFSQELCRRLGLRGTGGSDAHNLSDIPSYATSFEREIHSLRELIVELKAGRFSAVDLRPQGALWK